MFGGNQYLITRKKNGYFHYDLIFPYSHFFKISFPECLTGTLIHLKNKVLFFLIINYWLTSIIFFSYLLSTHKVIIYTNIL